MLDEPSAFAFSSSHAADILRALARAITSKLNTGRIPCSILEMVDWPTFRPNACKLVTSIIPGHAVDYNRHKLKELLIRI